MKQAEAFLKNTGAYLKALVDGWGYDSCHKINGLDVLQCAKDCEVKADSKFAKKCAEDNGLFKCCIR